MNTVGLDTLLEHYHKDEFDEIWVVKICDYQEGNPPENLIEAALTAVMLPFDKISDDDVEIFSHRLMQSAYRQKVKSIKINMNYGAVNYHWDHANLREGIKTGYNGTMRATEEYDTRKKKADHSEIKEPGIDLLTPPRHGRSLRWRSIIRKNK
jgi:hypothetical protein